MVLKHNGIKGSCHYNQEMKAFVGELQNTEYLITFKGGSLNEAKKEFVTAVNNYMKKSKTL